MPADAEVERLLAAVTVAGFDSPHALPPEGVATHVLGRAILRADDEGVDGLVALAVGDGSLPVTGEGFVLVAAHHRRMMEHALLVERATIAVSGALSAAGVDHRLLKGVALANLVYPDPAMRSFGDVDLLVEPGAFVRGAGAVVAMGGTRRIPEMAPGHDARFAKSITLDLEGISIDLHRTPVAGPYGEVVPVQRLFDEPLAMRVGDFSIDTLAPVDLFLHAALTAGVADVPARLITLRDLLEIERWSAIDAGAVLARAAALGIEAPLARAERILAAVLATPSAALSEWAQRHRSGLRDRLLVATYTGRARIYRRTLATLLVLPTWRDRSSFVRAIAMPAPGYRRAREWRRRDHITRALRRLAR